MKCKAPGKDFGFADTAKACSDQAKAEATGCGFFMYSTDYPVEGCRCCDKYEPVADDGKDGKLYDIY